MYIFIIQQETKNSKKIVCGTYDFLGKHGKWRITCTYDLFSLLVYFFVKICRIFCCFEFSLNLILPKMALTTWALIPKLQESCMWYIQLFWQTKKINVHKQHLFLFFVLFCGFFFANEYFMTICRIVCLSDFPKKEILPKWHIQLYCTNLARQDTWLFQEILD